MATNDTEPIDETDPDDETTVKIERQARRVDRAVDREHRRARTNMLLSVGVLAFIAVCMLVYFGMMQSRLSTATSTYSTDISQLLDDNKNLSDGQKQLVELIKAQNAEIRRLGGAPVPVPTPDEPAPSPPPLTVPGNTEQQPPLKGDKGDPPSPAEIFVAVSAFCRDTGECKADDGKPGVNGKNATPAQIAAAISTYCNTRGECKGEKGDQGDGPSEEQILAGLTAYCADDRCQGPKGIDGERGPGPTDEQIAEAVAGYCADDRCKGDDGEAGGKGDQGDRGEKGRGIERSVCEDGRWTNYFDDDTTGDGGSCVPAPAPTVTETITQTPAPTDDPT